MKNIIMQVTCFLNVLMVMLCYLQILGERFLKRNLATTLPFSGKFQRLNTIDGSIKVLQKFQRFNTIDGSIKMLQNS